MTKSSPRGPFYTPEDFYGKLRTYDEWETYCERSNAYNLASIAESMRTMAAYIHAIDAKLCNLGPVAREIRDTVASIDAKTKAPTVSVFTRDPDQVSAKSAAVKLHDNSSTENGRR